MQTIDEKIDNAVHVALMALGLSVEGCPDLADALNDWLWSQAPLYISDDFEDD